jgi:hypothetical protein
MENPPLFFEDLGPSNRTIASRSDLSSFDVNMNMTPTASPLLNLLPTLQEEEKAATKKKTELAETRRLRHLEIVRKGRVLKKVSSRYSPPPTDCDITRTQRLTDKQIHRKLVKKCAIK